MIAVYCPFHLIGERLNTKIADCEKNDLVFSHYYLVFDLSNGTDTNCLFLIQKPKLLMEKKFVNFEWLKIQYL